MSDAAPPVELRMTETDTANREEIAGLLNYRRLADALGASLGTRVKIETGPPNTIRKDRITLLHCSSLPSPALDQVDPDAVPFVLPLVCNPPGIFKAQGVYRTAGFVLDPGYFSWLNAAPGDESIGIVAEEPAVRMSGLTYEPFLGSLVAVSAGEHLPEILATYMTAYWRFINRRQDG